jgi:hypothetical protein
MWLSIAGYKHPILAPTALLSWELLVSHLWHYFIDLGTGSRCVPFPLVLCTLIYMAREAEAMLPSGTMTFSYGNTSDCVTCIPGSHTQTRESMMIDESGPLYELFNALMNLISKAPCPLPFITRLVSLSIHSRVELCPATPGESFRPAGSLHLATHESKDRQYVKAKHGVLGCQAQQAASII